LIYSKFMKHTLLFLFIIFSNTLFSQSINVTYFLDFPLDTNKVSVRSTEEFLLSADNNASKFRPTILYQKDRLMDSLRKGLVNQFDAKSKYKLMKSHFNFGLFISTVNCVYMEDLKGPQYNYEFAKPIFDWEIEDSVKIINGYKCTKAVSVIKNKKYVAWFTEEIPLSNGPYVFGGLPGLILQLDCKDKINFSFTMIGISKISSPVVLVPLTRFKVKNLQEFIAIKNEYKLAPNTFMFKSGLANEPLDSPYFMKKFDDANKASIEKMKYENFEFDLF
jgi:GLPGLI family protein